MKKNTLFTIVALSLLFYNSSCNRNTSGNEEKTTAHEQKKIEPEITPDDPFRNQPNNFCTIIRKLEVTYYDPAIQTDDPSSYPQKYCLLDVCLDDPDNSSGILNIGDSIDMMNTYYQLIKVFDSKEEARAYAEKYQIKDNELDK